MCVLLLFNQHHPSIEGKLVYSNVKVVCVLDLPSTGKAAVASGGSKQPAAAAAVASGGMSDADADLEARLENLRRQ